MKYLEISEDFDIPRSINVNDVIAKALEYRSKYPAGSISQREMVAEMYVKDISRDEAEKLANELTAELSSAIFQFHERIAKKKKTKLILKDKK